MRILLLICLCGRVSGRRSGAGLRWTIHGLWRSRRIASVGTGLQRGERAGGTMLNGTRWAQLALGGSV